MKNEKYDKLFNNQYNTVVSTGNRCSLVIEDLLTLADKMFECDTKDVVKLTEIAIFLKTLHTQLLLFKRQIKSERYICSTCKSCVQCPKAFDCPEGLYGVCEHYIFASERYLCPTCKSNTQCPEAYNCPEGLYGVCEHYIFAGED